MADNQRQRVPPSRKPRLLPMTVACFWLGPISVLTAILILVISLATDSWMTYEKAGTSFHGGLFRLCFSDGTCTVWANTEVNYDLAMLSIAAFLIACVLYMQSFIILTIFARRAVKHLVGGYWTGFTIWTAAILLNISGIIFFQQFQDQSSPIKYLDKPMSALSDTANGYSFHLSWLALLVALAGCVAASVYDFVFQPLERARDGPGGGGGGGSASGGGGFDNPCYQPVKVEHIVLYE